jgi:hypothetical protein
MEVGSIIQPWSNISCIMKRRNPRLQIISPLMMSSIMELTMVNPRGFTLIMSALNWSCEGRDSGSSFLGYTDHSPTALDYVASLFLLFLPVWKCSLRGRKPSYPHSTQPSRAAKAAIDVTEFYEDFVPEVDKAKMKDLEDEVRQIREFQDDDDVEV